MPTNCEREWSTERMEIVGFGRRFGTSPFGQRARGYHLGSTSFGVSALSDGGNESALAAADTATDGENSESSWQSV